MRRLLEESSTKAFQGVKNGAQWIKDDMVWLPKTARASFSQHPRILSFLGVQKGQSSLQPAFHLVVLQPGGLWQDEFNWTLFSPSCLSQQADRGSSNSVICGRMCLSIRPHCHICLFTLRCSTGGGTRHFTNIWKTINLPDTNSSLLALPVWLSHGELAPGLAPSTHV